MDYDYGWQPCYWYIQASDNMFNRSKTLMQNQFRSDPPPLVLSTSEIPSLSIEGWSSKDPTEQNIKVRDNSDY